MSFYSTGQFFVLCYSRMALLRGPVFPSLREELFSNSTKQSS
ncbi:MAG: hypothetical protein O7C68_01155 [Rickettsia endosymbiont of Ixodes ricinus]|nr:hypothetical protein [Rickettsia endosymbiont of Ixodes ricinus]